jgi:succinate dehydrogenase / fumarate reductase iron-sulfur subunit
MSDQHESRSGEVQLRHPYGGYVVPDGKLPVNEALFDRAGAPSPFGDDVVFPLPPSELSYVHPHEDAAPQHL